MNKIHCKNKNKIQTGVQLWSKNDDVATPDDLYKALNNEFGFDFDPCPLGGKADFDGLALDWGKCNYVNPPYSEIKDWLKKAIIEMKKGNKSVFLIPLRMNTKYWDQYVYPYVCELRPIAGYIKFKGYEKIRGLNTPIGLVIYDPKKYTSKFTKKNNIHFSKIGEKEMICLEW